MQQVIIILETYLEQAFQYLQFLVYRLRSSLHARLWLYTVQYALVTFISGKYIGLNEIYLQLALFWF